MRHSSGMIFSQQSAEHLEMLSPLWHRKVSLVMQKVELLVGRWQAYCKA